MPRHKRRRMLPVFHAPQAMSVPRWLYTISGTIAAMVIVGGITRLTNSGLSIVEWQPILGVVPPLHETAWREAFVQYQAYPQFQHGAGATTLEAFKHLYFWEWLHRLLGRLIGVAFFLPWAYFEFRRQVSGRLRGHLAAIGSLGALQAVLGWLMVKSGLVHEPRVSHYRLAAHLLAALTIYAYLLTIAKQESRCRRNARTSPVFDVALHRVGLILLGLYAVQAVYGAFMSGLHAGYVSASWPTMNGEWFPTNFAALSPAWRNFVENPIGVHFIHRSLAYGFAAGVAGCVALAIRRRASPQVIRATLLLAVAAFVQIALGIATVMRHVPLWLAALHQGSACLLLASLVFYVSVNRTSAPGLAPLMQRKAGYDGDRQFFRKFARK